MQIQLVYLKILINQGFNLAKPCSLFKKPFQSKFLIVIAVKYLMQHAFGYRLKSHLIQENL